jgi:hypothetical protein
LVSQLREEHRLRVFEDRVLRKIFGPRRDDIGGEWKRLYNEESYDRHSSSDIIWVIKSRRMSWSGHVDRKGEKRGSCKLFGWET